MKIVLVHGFNVKDKGAKTTDRLGMYANTLGYELDLDEGDYGYFNLFMIRFSKKRIRQRVIFRLAEAFKSADVIITHSNGANFTTQALDLLPPAYNNTKIVIHISPALDCDTEPPEAVKSQLVMHTPHDGWVRVSSYLLGHPWGRMGARGYRGYSNKVTNLENSAIKGHSAWFNPTHLRRTWQRCHEFIRSHS